MSLNNRIYTDVDMIFFDLIYSLEFVLKLIFKYLDVTIYSICKCVIP